MLVGVKSVLTDEELQELFKHCALQKVSLFFLEGENSRKTLPNERKIIITEDLCEIVENIDETC